MRQTTLSVPLEVKPESCAQLTRLIEALRNANQPAGYPDQYARMLRETPALHFMSLSIFPDAAFDPLFVLEANFDGPPGVFWGQLEATLGPELRDMLRCCKAPLDEDALLYAAVTAAGSRAPIAPYLEARTQRPSVFHHGNRGLSRDRILADGALFLAIRAALAGPETIGVSPYAGAAPQDLHARLRQALVPRFPWLDEAAPPRISGLERLIDIARLFWFAIAAIFCLSAPGLILSLAMPTTRYLMLIAALIALIGVLVFRKRAPLPGTGVPSRFRLVGVLLRQAPLILLVLAVYVFAATAASVVPAALITGLDARQALPETARWVLLGLASAPLSLVVILLWLRYLERRDSARDAPDVDETMLAGMVRREDWIAQNHMGSVVLLKPGVLRAILVHAGHLGLGLLLRV